MVFSNSLRPGRYLAYTVRVIHREGGFEVCNNTTTNYPAVGPLGLSPTTYSESWAPDRRSCHDYFLENGLGACVLRPQVD